MEASSPRTELRFACLYPVLIGVCFALQIAAIAYVAFHAAPPPGAELNAVPGARPIGEWYHKAPFRLIAHAVGLPRWLWPAFTILGIVQSTGLYFLYRAILREGFAGALRATAIGTAVAMAAIALFAPVVTSADAFAYIGYGFAPTYHDSLVTGKLHLAGQFAIINDMYGAPLVPNVYGPAFYALMSFVRLWNVPLIADLYALRILGLAASLGVIWLLSRRLPIAARATLFLSPALDIDWVLDLHNDVYAVLMAVAALVLMRRWAALAVIAASIAALLKLALLPVGLSLVAVQKNVIARVGIALAIALLSAGAMWALDGPTFVRNVLPHAALSRAPSGSGPVTGAGGHSLVLRSIVLLGIALVAGCAVVFGRATAGNSYLFSALAPAAFPWYLLWGIPYAAMASDVFALATIPLPALTAFANPEMVPAIPTQIILWGFAAAMAIACASLRLYRDVRT